MISITYSWALYFSAILTIIRGSYIFLMVLFYYCVVDDKFVS